MSSPIKAWRRWPAIVRFLIRNVATGFGIAALFVGALVAVNPNGAGTVLLTGADHWWPVVALWFFTGLTFGAAQIGFATMPTTGPRKLRRHIGAPAPLAIPVRAGRRLR